jgi:hypothetical protein
VVGRALGRLVQGFEVMDVFHISRDELPAGLYGLASAVEMS